VKKAYAASRRPRKASPARRCALGTVAGDLTQRRLLVLPQRMDCSPGCLRQVARTGGRTSTTPSWQLRPAYFVHPSSFAPALIALGAKVRIFGPKGAREITLEQFFVSPKTDGERETVSTQRDRHRYPRAPAAGIQSAVCEIRERQSLDWPSRGGGRAENPGGRITAARVVLDM